MPQFPQSREPQETGPTLSEVTEVGREVLKYTIIGLVSFMVLRMMGTAFVKYWKATHPEPPPPPTVGFGKLPALDYPKEAARPDTFQLETANNTLPAFGDRAKVLFMPFSSPNLLADDKARTIAKKLGFEGQPDAISSNVYRWNKKQPLNTTLEIDLKNYNFSLDTDYLSRIELVDASLPDGRSAIDRVKSVLKSTNLLSQDVATSSGQVTYLKALGGELLEAVSVSDADYIQVDLDRVPLDNKYEMYTPGGEEGVISAVVTGAFKRYESLVEMDYRYQPVDYDQVETYPIKTAKEAWQQLKKGEGYIAQGVEGKAVVRSVELGYYDSFKEQQYLQPVYVFRGDDNFMAYVNAVSDQYIQSEPK